MNSFENIYKIILKVVFVFFTGLFALAAYALAFFLTEEAIWRMPAVFIGCIIGVIISSYLYVILKIPYSIAKEFDLIQNKVALRTYKSVEEFQLEIADFLIGFFKYPGVQLQGGVFSFKSCKTYITPPLDTIIQESDIKAIENEPNRNIRRVRINNMLAYYIPIGFKQHELGSMILFTKGQCLPFFKNILVDFEDYFLDDQLMHVLNQTGQPSI